MTQSALARSGWRWVPFAILVMLALSFEPFRSGFTFTNQSCELDPDWQRVLGAIANPRHLIGYGVIFLAVVFGLGADKVIQAAAATFTFSAFMEVQQTFFATGHCRLSDLIPNAAAIAAFRILFQTPQPLPLLRFSLG